MANIVFEKLKNTIIKVLIVQKIEEGAKRNNISEQTKQVIFFPPNAFVLLPGHRNLCMVSLWLQFSPRLAFFSYKPVAGVKLTPHGIVLWNPNSAFYGVLIT